MTEKTVEERLAALEAAVAELQRRGGAPVSTANWLEQVAGSVKDVEALREVYELGRAFREADRPPDDEEADP